METFETKYEETQQLRENIYEWDIDNTDRSWFISEHRIFGDVSHRFLLKKLFLTDWKNLESRNIEDGEIEEIFTNRLIEQNWVKIGELDDFYCVVRNLNNRTKDLLYSFCESILKVRNDVKNFKFTIHIKNTNSINTTINDILEFSLYKLTEQKVPTFEKIYEKELVVEE